MLKFNWCNYWGMGQTSIPCDSEVRDRLAGDKPDDASWSEYLSILHSDQEIVVENVAASEGVGYDDVQDAKREVLNRIDDLETELTTQHERLGP